jgi:orotate phosphoribosyltransferase
MGEFKNQVVEFLVQAGALTFGDFTTKSGRKTPYFVNTGNFNDGQLIEKLGQLYARHIQQLGLSDVEVLFGPAYKGISLAVSTSIALSNLLQRKVGFSFNRKEAKAHGDGGLIVGTQLQPKMKVILVEDVITAGTTLNEVVPWLREKFDVQLQAVVIAVDRAERGSEANESAVQESRRRHNLRIEPLITVHDIVNYLETQHPNGVAVDSAEKIRSYLEQYGA